MTEPEKGQWEQWWAQAEALRAVPDEPCFSSPAPATPEEIHSLTREEQATNYFTLCHVGRVRDLLNRVVGLLLTRGELHDQSKTRPPEVGAYAALLGERFKHPYGSAAAEEFRRRLGPALTHHYRHNRHHPEFHANGVDDMNLIDLVEMLCDWLAASETDVGGDIHRSLRLNGERFRLGPQLLRALENTLPLLGH